MVDLDLPQKHPLKISLLGLSILLVVWAIACIATAAAANHRGTTVVWEGEEIGDTEIEIEIYFIVYGFFPPLLYSAIFFGWDDEDSPASIFSFLCCGGLITLSWDPSDQDSILTISIVSLTL